MRTTNSTTPPPLPSVSQCLCATFIPSRTPPRATPVHAPNRMHHSASECIAFSKNRWFSLAHLNTRAPAQNDPTPIPPAGYLAARLHGVSLHRRAANPANARRLTPPNQSAQNEPTAPQKPTLR